MRLENRVWLKPVEAADYLAVSQRTVYRLAEERELVCARFRGCLRIRADSLARYIHRQVQLHALEADD